MQRDTCWGPICWEPPVRGHSCGAAFCSAEWLHTPGEPNVQRHVFCTMRLFCTMIACSGTLSAAIFCDALCGLFKHPASSNCCVRQASIPTMVCGGGGGAATLVDGCVVKGRQCACARACKHTPIFSVPHVQHRSHSTKHVPLQAGCRLPWLACVCVFVHTAPCTRFHPHQHQPHPLSSTWWRF